MTLSRLTAGIVVSELAGAGALALLFYYLPLSGAAEVADVWAVDRVVAYLLLFAGPLFIFLPLCHLLGLGPIWLLGAGSWALLGFVLIFVRAPARHEADFLTYTAFLAVLFVALLSTLTVPMAALGKRIFPPATRVAEMVRAVRQGGLLSLFVVALLALSPLGVLNWLNALLLFTIVALLEFFFLARD